MASRTPALAAARFVLFAAALLLPTLSLSVFGGLYLWEKGWMTWWAIAALMAAGIVLLLFRWSLPPPESESAADDGPADGGYAAPAEARAWSDVRALARRVDIDALASFPDLVALGQRTIAVVAARLHPERHDAVWQFTLPEALAICERVSVRLGLYARTHIPFGDRLTVAQILAIYRWRHLAGAAGRAYDVWRLIRLANPATAATNEARERISRAVIAWGREHVTRNLVQTYVEEVGRAAIDLYGGRLRSVLTASGAPPAPASAGLHLAAAPPPPPLPSAVVVLGSDPRRDEIAAALEAARRERWPNAYAAPLLPITSAGAVAPPGFSRRVLVRNAETAEILVWLLAAPGGPSPGDRAALAHIKDYFARQTHVLPPALLCLIAGAGDDPAELASLAGPFANGLSPVDAPPDRPDVALLSYRTFPGPEQIRDTARILDALVTMRPAALTVRALREHEQHRVRSRGGTLAAGRQAATAAASLASSLWRRRGNGG